MRRDSQIESHYIDKLNEVNLQLELADNEKRAMRIEIAEEK